MFPILIFAVSMLLSMLSNGYTATYYVAKTGSDSNSCAKAQSQSTPKFTIAQGRACLSSGDTLIIKGGTYAERITGGVPSGTSWSNVTTIKGAPGEAAILKPTGLQRIIELSSERYIVFENLILDGDNATGSSFGISLGGGSGQAANHLRFQDIEIKDVASTGVIDGPDDPVNTGGFNEFIRVKIRNLGSARLPCCPEHGFYISASNDLFDGVEVYDNRDDRGYGMHIYGGASFTFRNNIVRNSSFHHSAGSGGIAVRTDGTIFENNLFYNNGATGLVLTGRNANVVVRNNTVYGNAGSYGQGIILFQTGSGPISLINNLVSGNSQAGISIESAPGTTVSNNLSSNNAGGNFVDVSGQATLSNNLFGSSFNPKFVNPGAQDFHLQAGSAAIDVGVTIGALTTDKDGTTRPQGSKFDIGAYECRTSTLSPPAHFRLVDMSE